MRIVIAGAGAMGRSIAKELLNHGHQVTLMDHSASQMQVADVAEADWLLADVCSPEALSEADIEHADVLVAATGDDKVNLVASLLAKTEFAVPRTVARVNNPKNEWMFDETWGVDVAVSTPRIMTSLVEEVVSIGKPVHLFSFCASGVKLYSVHLPEECAVVGQRVDTLDLPSSTMIASVLRDRRALTPQPDLILEAEDEVLLLLPELSEPDLWQINRVFEKPDPDWADPEQED